jgi:hypothetical protein
MAVVAYGKYKLRATALLLNEKMGAISTELRAHQN